MQVISHFEWRDKNFITNMMLIRNRLFNVTVFIGSFKSCSKDKTLVTLSLST